MNTEQAPVGRPIDPARQGTLAEQVRELLHIRLDNEQAAIKAAVTSELVKEFHIFRLWCKASGYRALPASGPVVACYLMARMNSTASLDKVRTAARAIAAVHAEKQRYLDIAHLNAALAWAMDLDRSADLLEDNP
jgi:hypothetical protein